MSATQGRRVRILVEDIPGLSASALLDQEGTIWAVVGEHTPRPYHAISDVLAELLGDVLPTEVTIEFGRTCTDHQPMGPSHLRLVS
jgi:hypothetical protein